MFKFQNTLFTLLFGAISFSTFGQTAAVITGQDSSRRVITTAVPFLSFTPDARSGALGDVGVALSPDANSVHWNNGKLAFIESDIGFSINYTPWLGKIINDMSISYLAGYYKIDQVQTVAASLRYFDLGDIQLTDPFGSPLQVVNPREWAIDATYSRKLSQKIGIGITGRFIRSNLAGNFSATQDAKPGTSVAVDLGFYYTKDLFFAGKEANLSLGAHISNIGQKITYSGDSNEDFIPTNLRLGTAFKTSLDPFNTLTFALDFNKLMVPTPPVYEVDENGEFVVDTVTNQPVIARGKDPNRNLLSGMFGSFTDAPDGASEEFQEFMIAFGVEYWYKDLASFRAGYFYENANKGDRKYFTVGVGFRYQVFGLDVAYLIPQQNNHPLAETLRFSLLFNFNKKDKTPTPESLDQ